MWIVFALLATLFFGLRGILYQWTSQKNLNRDLLLFGVFFTGFITSLVGVLLLNQRWYGWEDVAVGLGLGFGSFAANALLHKGFSVGKASLISILAGLTPLFVLIFAFLIWKETLTAIQLFGFFIIFCGLLIIRYSSDISVDNLKGAQWGLLAALFFTFTDLMGKQSTRLEADVFATLTSMFGFGTFLFALRWLVKRKKFLASQYSATTNWSQIKTFSCGLIVGVANVTGMVAIISAFSIGNTGLVSAISGMNILLILLYSRVVLKETFSRREVLGLTAAFVGLLVLRLN
ncbi:DMT family transporter [Alteromonas sp. 1_MG-2023]|uniref:DMT family transporter n=1 Tax=Alteromonas sp. 1_MG-2023 TaxID=3062669 RepID=UPI0026E2CA9D|nr:DMT family transporter [Alteromonas sp. 1_MG-2023]MDO6568641.1 DMT family transporter [Alteromonas sp. 1_MG-2023]